MKYFILLFLALQLAACASYNIAKNLNFVSFDENAKSDSLKSIGPVDGKDCTWYVAGYAIGEDPTVRKAFASAAAQEEGSLIPGQQSTKKGDSLKVVKNIAVESGGFNLWLVSRQCMIVTGAGFR